MPMQSTQNGTPDESFFPSINQSFNEPMDQLCTMVEMVNNDFKTIQWLKKRIPKHDHLIFFLYCVAPTGAQDIASNNQ